MSGNSKIRLKCSIQHLLHRQPQTLRCQQMYLQSYCPQYYIIVEICCRISSGWQIKLSLLPGSLLSNLSSCFFIPYNTNILWYKHNTPFCTRSTNGGCIYVALITLPLQTSPDFSVYPHPVPLPRMYNMQLTAIQPLLQRM